MNSSQTNENACHTETLADMAAARSQAYRANAQGNVSKPGDLVEQNRHHCGTGGVSQGNSSLGFAPAFQDSASGEVFLSRFADGNPAPFHLLDGLPGHLIIEYDVSGRPRRVIASLVAGFVRYGHFYTRQQAAEAARAHAA